MRNLIILLVFAISATVFAQDTNPNEVRGTIYVFNNTLTNGVPDPKIPGNNIYQIMLNAGMLEVSLSQYEKSFWPGEWKGAVRLNFIMKRVPRQRDIVENGKVVGIETYYDKRDPLITAYTNPVPIGLNEWRGLKPLLTQHSTGYYF